MLRLLKIQGCSHCQAEYFLSSSFWLLETFHSKAETLLVQSLSGPPKVVARMIVKHPIAALYLHK